jgi:Flp pilus assembly pilin Flp
MIRRGQSTTEYMLLLAFLAVALVATAYTFVPVFGSGMTGLTNDGSTLMGAGTENGRNNKR